MSAARPPPGRRWRRRRQHAGVLGADRLAGRRRRRRTPGRRAARSARSRRVGQRRDRRGTSPGRPRSARAAPRPPSRLRHAPDATARGRGRAGRRPGGTPARAARPGTDRPPLTTAARSPRRVRCSDRSAALVGRPATPRHSSSHSTGDAVSTVGVAAAGRPRPRSPARGHALEARTTCSVVGPPARRARGRTRCRWRRPRSRPRSRRRRRCGATPPSSLPHGARAAPGRWRTRTSPDGRATASAVRPVPVRRRPEVRRYVAQRHRLRRPSGRPTAPTEGQRTVAAVPATGRRPVRVDVAPPAPRVSRPRGQATPATAPAGPQKTSTHGHPRPASPRSCSARLGLGCSAIGAEPDHDASRRWPRTAIAGLVLSIRLPADQAWSMVDFAFAADHRGRPDGRRSSQSRRRRRRPRTPRSDGPRGRRRPCSAACQIDRSCRWARVRRGCRRPSPRPRSTSSLDHRRCAPRSRVAADPAATDPASCQDVQMTPDNLQPTADAVSDGEDPTYLDAALTEDDARCGRGLRRRRPTRHDEAPGRLRHGARPGVSARWAILGSNQ